MVMTKAALGMPLLDCLRALTAATMSVAAHTSKALALAGISTTSATRTAGAGVADAGRAVEDYPVVAPG